MQKYAAALHDTMARLSHFISLLVVNLQGMLMDLV